jgi:hypothetical protein
MNKTEVRKIVNMWYKQFDENDIFHYEVKNDNYIGIWIEQ